MKKRQAYISSSPQFPRDSPEDFESHFSGHRSYSHNVASSSCKRGWEINCAIATLNKIRVPDNKGRIIAASHILLPLRVVEEIK